MIGKFSEMKKWKDYINLKEFEVKTSLLLTFLIVMILRWIGFYEHFNIYSEIVLDIIPVLLGGFIGLIGFTLAGIAIVTTMLDKNIVERVERVNEVDVVDEVLTNFEFAGFNIGIVIVILIILPFMLSGVLPVLNSFVFWIVLCLALYYILFNLFYVISLISNCVKLYKIKKVYDELVRVDKNFMNKVNEIRIDFLIEEMLLDKYKESTVIKEKMLSFAKRVENEEKDQIIMYFKKYYS